MTKWKRQRSFLILVLLVGIVTSLIALISIHRFYSFTVDDTTTTVGFELPQSSSSSSSSNNWKSNHIPETAPRFLLGIFSHDRFQQESDRRQMIRETYLQYYPKYEPTHPHRICALQDILFNTKTNITWENCQMAYTFVTGEIDNPQHNHTVNVHATTSKELGTDHEDLVKLHIQENGDLGKTPTWFHYATLLIQEYQLPIDYVIKTDSDTLLIPHRFFRWAQEQEEQQLQQAKRSDISSSTRRRIYGGLPMDKYACGYPTHDHCDNLTAPIYMGGALYFLSVDLARDASQYPLTIPHEDMAMGNAVYSFAGITNFSHPDAYLNTWKHPVKNPKRMKSMWRKMIQKKQERVKQKKLLLQQQGNSTTISTTV